MPQVTWLKEVANDIGEGTLVLRHMHVPRELFRGISANWGVTAWEYLDEENMIDLMLTPLLLLPRMGWVGSTVVQAGEEPVHRTILNVNYCAHGMELCSATNLSDCRLTATT